MTPSIRFLVRGSLFSAPILAWVLAVAIVDPFNYFRLSSIIPDKAKVENAASLNSLMFNMLKAAHEPHDRLVIGDSRAESLPIELIPARSYFLLSASASKINESIDLFYFAQRSRPLKHVVFTINFNQFNQFAYADRVRSVEDMIKNPLLYIFNRNVAEAAYHVLSATLTGKQSFSSIPPMNEGQFWSFMVSVRATEHYARYRYPDALYSRMNEMVSFSRKNNIDLTFIIVPHHTDFQRRVREYGLVEDYLRFKRDMSRLDVRVIDYDYINAITTDRSCFRDPVHYNHEVGKLIVRDVFQGPLVVGKLLDTAWAEKCAQFVF